jgi:ADP-ribose pyrophosphatase
MTEKSKEQQEIEEKATVTSTTPFKCSIFSVRSDSILLPDGTVRKRSYVIHPGAVVIIPLLKENEILLIKQYRRPTGRLLLELPAGMLEGNEQPEERAMKELQEETGYRADELIPYGGMYSAPGFCNEYLHFFLAKDLYPDPLCADDDEAIDLVPTLLQDALAMIDEGTINDAKTIAGIFKYVRFLSR